MSQVEQRLNDLGLHLEPPPQAAGNYLPFRISGNQLFLSGVLPVHGGSLTHTGKVGAGQTPESGYEAARNCVLVALANAKAALGSLDRIRQFLLVSGYVNGVDGFADSPKVINGASDLLVEVFGDTGRHARAAVAVAGLPADATVELQITLEFE